MKSKKLTKALLYQDITQQGFILPKSSSTICNLAYLLRVRNGVEYCPSQDQINGIICSNPPKKMLLLMYIQEELDKIGDIRTLSFDEKHLPDVDWCLKALSSLDPLHQIFEPDYIPPFNHRGRRGTRYIPTSEDLLFRDEEKLRDRNFSNQSAEVLQNQFTFTHKQESKASNFRKQSKQQDKNDERSLNKDQLGQQVYFQSQERQSDKSKDQKSFSNQKDLIENKQIGPLVQMLKTLDDKGLLEECMQHYIEIQTSYDKVNNEKQQAKPQSEILKNQPKCKDKKKGGYFINEKDYKQMDIKYQFDKKQNQFSQIQSPSKNVIYDGESYHFQSQKFTNKYKKQQYHKDLESHKTSASSDMKNQQPVEIMEKVKAFETTEKKDIMDEEKINQKDQLMTEENDILQFEDISEKPTDEKAENPIQDKDQTPQAIFII